MIKLSHLRDPEELNRLLRADPALCANMREMGFIKPVPFMRDHNEQFETQFMLTEYGEREMRERMRETAVFAATGGGTNA